MGSLLNRYQTDAWGSPIARQSARDAVEQASKLLADRAERQRLAIEAARQSLAQAEEAARAVAIVTENQPAVTGKKRGRPRKPGALSPAEKQRAYRMRKAGKGA